MSVDAAFHYLDKVAPEKYNFGRPFAFDVDNKSGIKVANGSVTYVYSGPLNGPKADNAFYSSDAPTKMVRSNELIISGG